MGIREGRPARAPVGRARSLLSFETLARIAFGSQTDIEVDAESQVLTFVDCLSFASVIEKFCIV